MTSLVVGEDVAVIPPSIIQCNGVVGVCIQASKLKYQQTNDLMIKKRTGIAGIVVHTVQGSPRLRIDEG